MITKKINKGHKNGCKNVIIEEVECTGFVCIPEAVKKDGQWEILMKER